MNQPKPKVGRKPMFPGQETRRLMLTAPLELVNWYKTQPLGTEVAILQDYHDRWKVFSEMGDEQ